MMIPRPCFWGRILVLITSLLVSNASDPCGSYKSLDNPYRSTGYVAREGIDPMICDYDLQTGWYRFVNEVGGKMPETKVGSGHCGTIAPIWMQGQHPSTAEGTVDRTACVNFNNQYGGCIPISIKVRNCSEFFVYRLVAPFGCHMAYCAGTLQPCPRGQSGLFPNCTVLRRADFPFDQVPVPSVTYIDDTEITVTLNCDFTVPPWGNVSFEIRWFVNGEVSKSAQCDDPATSQCAHLEHHDYQLGSHIRCEIRAKYNTHPNNSWTQAKSSEIFYAGIEVHPTHLSVLECNASSDNRISLRPTLPIRGDRDIRVKFGTDDDFEALLASKCVITLKHGEEHEWTNISIQAVCDNTNRIFGSSSFTFSVSDTHQFWPLGHQTIPVTIAKVENPVDNCIATGDPHYTTFDGKRYDFYGPGDFVLYRNKDRAFEIHTRLWSCWGVTCNCGVAIREKHDVIILTTCTQDLQMTYGMPMKVLITSQRQLTRGTKIFVRHPGSSSEYEVRLPSGTVVRIKRYYWGNNVEMQAPRSDKSKTEGMCGNFDGDATNEFEFGGPDGDQNTADQNSFGESWRVNRTNSLFHIVPNCTEEACDTSELDMDRCQCQKKSGNQISVTCNLPLMQFSSMGGEDWTEEAGGAGRKKRDLANSDDIIYLYDDEEPKRNIPHQRGRRAVNTKMSLENATEYCRNAILNTAAAKVCLEISGVNASNAIEACAADLQFTGDLRWVESAFEGLKSTCEFQAVNNFSAYDKDEEGNFVPPVKIAQNLCPNDCSFNGNCTNGTCICKEGFIAEDCSMRENEIPSLFRILDKGLCDVRVRPCLKTIVFGENFLNSKNLTCHVKEFSVIPSKWLPSNETKKLNGSKTDLFAIECQLPTPPMDLGNYDVEGSPAAGYMISVSNDKVHKSLQALTLITFDSICQECNVSQGCSLKKRSCLIKGHCFAEGKPNPKNWCELCNSSASQDLWSKRVVNYPPNITTSNQRYALLGEDLELQLEGEDPEQRPFVISMMSGSPPGAKLTNQGVLQWRPQSTVKENFYFKATDECNASSTFEMSVEILTCPCTDKGVCLPDPNHPRGSGMYYCKCQPGYEGQRCEREIDECLSIPCVHGTCIDMVNNYSCQCQPGYTGYNCSFEIDECQSSPCINGSCTDMLNAFACTCQSGFTGPRCEVNINDCPSSGCGNGTCIDLIENYTCQCNVGFAGESCNIVIRNCSNDSCFHGVRCIQLENTIACGPCPTGYTGNGKHCKDIDHCINATCKNGGSCVDGLRNYSCICSAGFIGDQCETDIDDCVNHTCANGGLCVDGVNTYSCNCSYTGYTGERCLTDIDDCTNHTCANGGLCVDGVNSYSCNCSAGYTGERCLTDIDDCVNHTCANGGLCVDGVNTYSCNCSAGYTGERCLTVVTRSLAEESTIMTNTSATTFSSIMITRSLKDVLLSTSNSAFTSAYTQQQEESTLLTITSSAALSSSAFKATTSRSMPPSTKEREAVFSPSSNNGASAVSSLNLPPSKSVLTTATKSSVRQSSIIPGFTSTQKPETEHVFKMKLLQDWNDELKDTESTAFKALSMRFETEMMRALSSRKTLIGVKVISFSKGSVVVEFQMMFRSKVPSDEAFADLKNQINDGNLGNLQVDPASLEQIYPTTQVPTKKDERNLSFPIIIGISFGGFFIVALITILLVRQCHKKKLLETRNHSNVMPSDEAFPNRQKYEVEKAKSVENFYLEEKGLWAKPIEGKENEAYDKL